MGSGDPEKLPSEAMVYFRYLLGLWPGHAVPTFEIHQAEPGNMESWSDDDAALVLQEGRRQLDRQGSDLEGIRSRVQFLFTTCLGLLALTLAGTKALTAIPRWWVLVLWSVSILSTIASLLGCAAVIVSRKEMGAIDSTRLSRQRSPVLPTLAASYARVVRVGENTLATHITVYRDAVLLALIGAALYGTAWLGAVL